MTAFSAVRSESVTFRLPRTQRAAAARSCHNELYRKLIKGYMQRHKARPVPKGENAQ